MMLIEDICDSVSEHKENNFSVVVLSLECILESLGSFKSPNIQGSP